MATGSSVTHRRLAVLRSVLLGLVFVGPVVLGLVAGARAGLLGPRAILAISALLLLGALALQIGGVRSALSGTEALCDPVLDALLEELARRVGIGPPELRVAHRGGVGAFTTGRLGGRPVVVVSAGLLARSDISELEAVLAHELAHVVHRDVAALGTERAALVILATPGRLATVVAGLLLWPAKRRDLAARVCAGVLFGAVALVGALPPTLMGLAVAAVSRRRELWADDTACALVGDGEGLARVLRRLPERSTRWRVLDDHPRRAARLRRIDRRARGRRRRGGAGSPLRSGRGRTRS